MNLISLRSKNMRSKFKEKEKTTKHKRTSKVCEKEKQQKSKG